MRSDPRQIIFALLVVLMPLAAWAEDPALTRFRFVDVTKDTGLAEPFYGAFHHAMAWGDFDSDGRPDLFLGNFAERGSYVQFGLKQCKQNMLLRQSAPGKFEPFASPAVEIPGRCSGAAFVDLDNDGDLDLYVTSNTKAKLSPDEPKRTAQAQLCRLYRNDGGGKFVDVSAGSGACPSEMFRSRDVGVLDFDGYGLLDLLVMQDKGTEPEDKVTGVKLFHNLGQFRFEDVAAKVGLPNDLWGAGIAIADVNDDRHSDVYICGINRLYLGTPERTFREASTLRPLFSHPEKDLDWVTGASFGDLDGDGDLDLATGRHSYFTRSRIHVYLNDGPQNGEPRFREITQDLGLAPLPQKAPHPEIADFNNDGIPDLYWSVFLVDNGVRRPFICRGLGVKDGLPRFEVPDVTGIEPILDKEGKVTNELPASGRGMVYYVNGPAVDYDGDGDLDLCCGNWPPESCKVHRNESSGGHWLEVQVRGKTTNRMGLGARIELYRPGQVGVKSGLIGAREITVNGGYSSSRPAVAHFGLGTIDGCDVRVVFPNSEEPLLVSNVKCDRLLTLEER